jgi:hypothetical protein
MTPKDSEMKGPEQGGGGGGSGEGGLNGLFIENGSLPTGMSKDSDL